jgi:MFS family permease
LFFQFVDGDSALEAAVRLLPYIVFYVVSCIASGALMSKFGYYMPWYLSAGIFVVVGSALMITIDNVSSTAHVYGYSILLGIGSGSYCQASFAVAQGKVKMEDIPSAVGFITNAQVSGIAIALSTAEAIFLNESATRIHALFPALSMEQVNSMITGVGSTSVTMLPEATKEVALQVIIFAISRTYILVLTAGCLTIVLSLFMKREKLFMTAAVAS